MSVYKRWCVGLQVYGERRRALMASDLSPQMVEYAERTVDDILEVSHPTSSIDSPNRTVPLA